MKTLLKILLCSIPLPVFSQTLLKYNYDDVGNRISREIIIQKQKNQDSADLPVKHVEEKLLNRNITIYPNPTKGELKIVISDISDKDNIEAYIYSSTGLLINKCVLCNESIIINITNQPSGIYFLTLMIEGSKHTWKIIKE